MLACAGCLKHGLHPVVGRGSLMETCRALPTLQHGLPMRQIGHSYATAASAPRIDDKAIQDRRAKSVDYRNQFRGHNGSDATSGNVKRRPKSGIDVDTIKEDAERADKTSTERQKRLLHEVKKQLQYLDNPYNLAKHVEAMLKKDRTEEAQLLVQIASKGKQCVVAWNFVIDHEIRKNARLNAAMRLFNDMKKRGQLPNQLTYTIIFRGCAKSANPEAALQKAVHVYKMMLDDTRGGEKRIQPNSIHLNAVLEVCARAGDIETMLSIAETVDDSAGRPATAYTYTILINGLRAQLLQKHDPEGTGNAPSTEVRQTIHRCKAIWEEAASKWRSGKLRIDEDLVHAWGRVLLLGDEPDKKKIFPLLEETMCVPNLLRPGDDEKYINSMKKGMKGIATGCGGRPKIAPGTSGALYAVPSRKALSLILDALVQHRNAKMVSRYWELFTAFYGVETDPGHYSKMMQVFERNSSSKDATMFLANLPVEDRKLVYYRRAMFSCFKDNMNPSAFSHATRIMALMSEIVTKKEKNAEDWIPYDMRTLHIYCDVARLADYNFRKMAKAGDVEQSRRLHAQQQIAAINQLWQPYLDIKQLICVRPDPVASEKMIQQKYHQGLKELIILARKMLRIIDHLLQGQMIDDKELLVRFRNRRNSLNEFLAEQPSTDSADPIEAVRRRREDLVEATTTVKYDEWKGPQRGRIGGRRRGSTRGRR